MRGRESLTLWRYTKLVTLAFLMAATYRGVFAQSRAGSVPASPTPQAQSGVAMGSLPTGGEAQSGASVRRAWEIAPRLGLAETFTDNVLPGGSAKQSDQITEITPGVRILGKAARAKVYGDYQLRGLMYAQGSRGNTTQNVLNSFGTLEAIEKLFFVDVSGVVAQQTISAFGTQSPGGYSINSNTTETSNFRFSPYLRGTLGGYADYEARYSKSALRTKAAATYDSDINEWSGKIGGNTPFSALGWSVDGSQQSYDYGHGRKTKSDRWHGRISYKVVPHLKFSMSGGRERNDFVSLHEGSWSTRGYGVDWAPTERTQISVFREKRFFGHGHTASISHRMPSSAVMYTDSRNVSALPSRLATVGLGNIYDLLFTQKASSIPDPVERAAWVDGYLNAIHIPPSTPVTVGFLSSQVSVQRSQNLSWIWYGARNTLTLALVRTQNDRLGTGLGTGDDFSIASSIIQKGGNINFSHRLSALSSLTVSGTRTRNSGSIGGGLAAYNQKMFSAGITTRIGANTNAVLTARRTQFDRSANSYTENAVSGSLLMQF